MIETRRALLPSRTILAALVATSCSDVLGPLDQLPRELTVAERTALASVNRFGIDLFAKLTEAQRDENVFFSPLSAYMALGMTANGAAGETLDGMRATLRQSELTEDEANAAYRGLLDLLLELDSEVELRIANSIWHRLDLGVRQSFTDLSRTVFDATVQALDFSDPGSVETINTWVETETRGRIEDLVTELTPEDVMLLINAVYFKGPWESQFLPSNTRPAPFLRLSGGTVDVPTMERRDIEALRYQRREEFEAAELLYGRGAFAMTILLPPEGVAPADLIASASAETWNGWMAGFEETDAISIVRLPKFRLEWEKRLDDDLRAMGMEVAFDGGADFSRLAEGGEGFFISMVKQKAFVEVNEEGTEAAAATSVNIAERARPTFQVDRPFLFAIRERFSGAVLFLGQVLDPTAG